MNKLFEVNCEHWKDLRNLYKVNWPRFISSYSVIDTFIEWTTASDTQNDLVKFYSFDEKWRNHGTYIAVVRRFLNPFYG